MGELGLPTWGIGTLVGLPLTILLFIVIQFFRGDLATRKQIDQVQKTADSWQHAWEVSEQTKQDYAVLLKQLIVTAQTVEKLVEALPPPSKATESRPEWSAP